MIVAQITVRLFAWLTNRTITGHSVKFLDVRKPRDIRPVPGENLLAVFILFYLGNRFETRPLSGDVNSPDTGE
jgi:hypothetical protein